MSSGESAGVLLYRRTDEGVEFLIAHPGGPYWAKKDAGAWSIPKGLLEPGEDPLAAALRELAEETGFAVAAHGAVPLGSVRLKSGKLVHAWAVEAEVDPNTFVSNTFEIEWPPRSGRTTAFPEIDAVMWADRAEAADKLNRALLPLLDRLLDHLTTGP